ncbi:DUF2634 domain-containing protein [Paenibacillus sp. YIM B09110]|uniref:DUF2634 domain-containing protein n=1 Tax=Paenibacillus sp. YIM B09110 TaxID=3126102 RepID=UPI00301C4E73
MALSPLQSREERYEAVAPKASPSRTYLLNFDTGEVEERLINGVDALRQSIRKAIETARYRYMIYNGQYGCELNDLLGQDISQQLLKSEIKRVISEALLADDRIQSVGQFQIERVGDKLFASFAVTTSEGVMEQEVSI